MSCSPRMINGRHLDSTQPVDDIVAFDQALCGRPNRSTIASRPFLDPRRPRLSRVTTDQLRCQSFDKR
ncbi:hypothetical protein, partial [Rhodococcus erythropolis]|uniref:hypothetical protein n=1 Tax=Rhodococcus erythropolis TaxID=1833 RepID=UPI001C9B4C92